MDALEEALGTSLFVRSQNGLKPTPAAKTLVPHVQAMASAAGALSRAASGDASQERGAVRVTASEMIGAEVLPSAFASFHELHPAIDVELVLSNRTADLSRREADIAVRMVKPTQKALVMRKLGAVRIGLHAHPKYLQAHGVPRTLDEALRSSTPAQATHAMIGFDTATSVRPLPKLGFEVSRKMFAFRCDSDLGQYALLKAGVGLGFCQAGLAKRDGLTPVLRDAVSFSLDVWLVMHQDAKSTRRVRLLFDHLAEHLASYIASSR